MVSHLVTQSFHQSHNRTSDASLSIKRWLLLIGLTVVSTFMFEHSEIDVSISELFYHNGHWLIEKNAQPFRFMFYDFPKTLIILLGVYLLINLIVKKWKSSTAVSTQNSPKNKWLLPFSTTKFSSKELGYLLLTIIMVPAIIATLKSVTYVSCPNHLTIFGGDIPYLSLWQDILTKTPAKCFPAAHASAGFALYAFAYLPRFAHNKIKIMLVVSVLAWSMGLYKMMIGDHFFSHTLVSMWLSWAIVYGIALLFFRSTHSGSLQRR